MNKGEKQFDFVRVKEVEVHAVQLFVLYTSEARYLSIGIHFSKKVTN